MTINSELRGYFWTNHYLSPIQKGIQAAHCITNMMIDSAYDVEMNKWMTEWASFYKTIIVLNGGCLEHMNDLWKFLSHQNKYPVCKFHESDAAMGGMLTAIGIILPEQIYVTSQRIKDKEDFLEQLDDAKPTITNDEGQIYQLTDWEIQMITKLSTYPLA